MKVKITYQFHPDLDNHFFAYATIENARFVACSSQSFASARKQMIEKLADAKQKEALPIPPEEEIEI